MMKQKNLENQYLRSLISREQVLNADLLNRLQAGDYKAYMALSQQTTVPDLDEQKPKTDYQELLVISEGQGLGEPLYDDATDPEFADLLSEIGLSDNASTE